MSNSPTVETKQTKSEAQWFSDVGVDFSLFNLLINQNKDLGPEVLKDPKYDSLLNPFEMKWTFGFDVTVPVINLTDENRRQIFYTAANTGILYDYCKKEMVHFRGHQHRIISASADKTGKWVATADSGKDNVIMVWDTHTCAIVWTIFNYPNSENDLLRIALSPSAKLLITISNENDNTIDFWLWTYGKDKPDDSYTDDHNLGAPKAIEFHPNNEDHIMIVFEKAVFFFHWDHEKRKASAPATPKSSYTKGIGLYTDGTYVDLCHEAFVSTTKGNVLVFGNTIFAKNFDSEEGMDNNKMFVKCIKTSKGNVTCITSIDDVIATGDSTGTIMFFDKRLKLLYWFSRHLTKPICTISFKLCPRTYKLDYSKNIRDSNEDHYVIPDCQDRSEEYEILMTKTIPEDATLAKRPFITRDHFISTLDGTIYMMYLPKKRFIPLFPTADSNVAAIDVHDEKPYITIAYAKGRIIVFNYETHEEVISTILPDTDGDSTITALKYSSQCLHLACGKSNGELWLLQPALLAQIYVEPFQFSTKKVMKIVFSQSSLQMAYYDENMTIFGFYYDPESEDWVFKGKVRSHYKDICNILFLNEEPYGLYTMGKDRHLIKYTDLVAEYLLMREEEIDISIRDRIEQKDIPVYFIPYPKRKFSKSGYFLLVDDKHKFKILSIRTNMCTAVYLGPAYGCFQNNPVQKMEFIPKHSQRYLVFMTKKQIGIQLLPIDGNPYKYVGCLGHPEE
ncbi:WD repeat-containing protein 66-like, partial [Asbolus verrucosus]